MKGYAIKPGVIDPGHDATEGWHPGTKDDCPECKPRCTTRGTPQTKLPPSPPPSSDPVALHLDGRAVGSDCKTGKRQYVSRKAALGAYHSVQRNRGVGGANAPRPFRCAWCFCWHVGNRRGNASKSRHRR